LDTKRKVNLVIVFLLAVTSLLSISSTSSTLLLYDISTEDRREAEPFGVLVTVAGVERNCGEELK
jgi:hypothetical protein